MTQGTNGTASARKNGNGTKPPEAETPRADLVKRTHEIEGSPVGELLELPPWLRALREAMGSAIQGDDLRQIMAKQIEAAKGGDMKAAQFVMNQAHRMVQAEQKRVTIVQNNYYDTPADRRPDTPVEPTDDRDKELRKLSARAAAHAPVTGRPGDRRVRAVSDEEEKEMRRREQADEEERAAGTGPEAD